LGNFRWSKAKRNITFRNASLKSCQGEVVLEHMEIAQLVGLTLMDLECLVNGEATLNIAKKLGVSMMDVQEFTHGNATDAMARRLGFRTMNAASELAKKADGAGVLIGFILNMGE
jgi:hypothetical protein